MTIRRASLLKGLLLFLLLIFAGLALLLFTPAGQIALIRTVLPRVPGLAVESAEGHLFDLTLSGIRYEMPGLDVRAERLHAALSKADLWEGRLRVTDLSLEGADGKWDSAAFAAAAAGTDTADSAPLTTLESPLPVFVDRLHLQDIDFTADGTRVSLSSFESSLAWEGRLLTAKPGLASLHIIPPEKPEASEAKTKAAPEPLGQTLEALFSKPLMPALPDVTLPIDLELQDFAAEDLRLSGASPLHVRSLRLSASLKDGGAAVDAFSAVLPEGTLSLSGTLRMKDAWPVSLKADAALEIPPLAGEHVAFELTGELLGTLRAALEAKGPAEAKVSAETDLTRANPPLDLRIESKTLAFPLGSTAKTASAVLRNASATLRGTLRSYAFESRLAAEISGAPEGRVTLSGKGSLGGIDLFELGLETAGGRGNLSGNAAWPNDIRFDVKAGLSTLSLSAFLPQVDAVLSGNAAIKGSIRPDGKFAVDVPLFNLSGSAYGEPVRLDGRLALQSPRRLDVPALSASFGNNRAELKGEVNDRVFSADLKLDAPDLSRTLPGLRGRAAGTLNVRGDVDHPVLLADLQADGLGLEDFSLSSLTFKGRITADEKGTVGGDLTLAAARMKMPGAEIEKADVTLDGTQNAHRLTVSLTGSPVSGTAAAAGAFNLKSLDWQGALLAASFDTPAGSWTLRDRTDISYVHAKAAATISPHVWESRSGRLRFDQPLLAGAAGKLSALLEELNLDLFAPFLPEETALRGRINGRAAFSWDTRKTALPTGTVNLRGDGVSVMQETGGEAVTAVFEKLLLQGNLTPRDASLNWETAIRENGSVTGTVRIGDLAGARTLTGDASLRALNLQALSAFFPSGEKAEGTVNAALQFGGTLEKPLLFGDIALRDALVQGGMVPVEMKPSSVTLTFRGERSTLEGALETSQGTLSLQGDADWHDPAKWRAQLAAKGTDILITVPPTAQVTISPDVRIAATPELLRLNGRIDIPRARIEVQELPPSAVSVSDDEVMLTAERRPVLKKSASLPIQSDLTIHIADRAVLQAFGLRARLGGELKLRQDSRGLGLNGQVTVQSGRFRAYGQDLVVRKGEVIFAGSPEQPLLNLEAVRNPDSIEDGVTAGIRVTGNASRPKVTLFSEPSLSQTETLSYLLRGQGLSASGEGNDNSALTAALVGLGVSQTGSVIGAIGDAVGIRGLGVDTTGAGDESQVVVSGYILPDLQVKYGVGLFDSLATLTLRYRLMPRLYVEAASGVNQMIDLLYRFEF